MLASRNLLNLAGQRLLPTTWKTSLECHKQCFSTSVTKPAIFGPPDPMGRPPPRKNFKESIIPHEWERLVPKYPDFLPDPLDHNPFLVSLCIEDMLERRKVLEIPEFYVGSILRVETTNEYSDTKRTKFTGICIERRGRLEAHYFTLRNVIEGQGVEIRFEMYNPLILGIEVLKLQKRLDDELLYLRDAPLEYSTIPEDLQPDVIDEFTEVPIDKTIVKLNPPPWSRRWERHLYKGIHMEGVPEIWLDRRKLIENDNVHNFDTLVEYKRHCSEEMLYNICKRLHHHEETVVKPRKAERERRFLRVAKSPLIEEKSDQTTK